MQPTINAQATEAGDCIAQRRIRFVCHDEELQRRAQANTRNLIRTAVEGCNSPASATNTLLARKALKYRKLLQHVAKVDVADPSFDASRFLGVQWRKPECISV